MKKRRLLAIFAAFAIAATMSVGLTACAGGDNNQDGGDGDGDSSSYDSAYTEEEWVQAFANTFAQQSYKLVQSSTQAGKAPQTDENGEITYVDTATTVYLEAAMDLVGLKGYQMMEMTTQYGDEEPEIMSHQEVYAEIEDLTFNTYMLMYDEEGNLVWRAYTEYFDTEQEAKEYLSGDGMIEQMIASAEFVGIGENSEVTGTIDKIYSLFTYDEETHAYAATLAVTNAGSSAPEEMTVTVTFKDGKLNTMLMDYVIGEGAAALHAYSEITMTYDIIVNIPQEAKDALAANQQ